MQRIYAVLNRIGFKCVRGETEDGANDNNNKRRGFTDIDEKQKDGGATAGGGGGAAAGGGEGAAKSKGGDKKDNKSGLGARQVFSLNQSWKAVMRDDVTFGVEMFIRLFKTNSSLQTMFQGFKDIKSDDELRSNEALEYHATLVMTTLDDAITHIDNYDYVKQLLNKTGCSHIKFDGFRPSNFMTIKEPFLEAVRVTLGDRYTDNMQNIYNIAITFILQTLQEGLEEALEEKECDHGANNSNRNGNV